MHCMSDFDYTPLNRSKGIHFLQENENLLPQISQKEIATVLKTTPETLSRILSKLKKDDLITLERGKITIKNRQKLFLHLS